MLFITDSSVEALMDITRYILAAAEEDQHAPATMLSFWDNLGYETIQ